MIIDEERKNNIIKGAMNFSNWASLDDKSQQLFTNFIENDLFKLIKPIINVYCGDRCNYPEIKFKLNKEIYSLVFLETGIRLEKLENYQDGEYESRSRIDKNIFLKLLPQSIYFIDMLDTK